MRSSYLHFEVNEKQRLVNVLGPVLQIHFAFIPVSFLIRFIGR